MKYKGTFVKVYGREDPRLAERRMLDNLPSYSCIVPPIKTFTLHASSYEVVIPRGTPLLHNYSCDKDGSHAGGDVYYLMGREQGVEFTKEYKKMLKRYVKAKRTPTTPS